MGKPNNTVTIQGSLTYKPELKKLDSGLKLANGFVNITDTYKNGAGEEVTTQQSIPFTAFGDNAVKLCTKCNKFSPVKIVGHLKNEKFTNKAGQEQSILKVIVSNHKDSVKPLIAS